MAVKVLGGISDHVTLIEFSRDILFRNPTWFVFKLHRNSGIEFIYYRNTTRLTWLFQTCIAKCIFGAVPTVHNKSLIFADLFIQVAKIAFSAKHFENRNRDFNENT